MAATKLVTHVPPDANPVNVTEMILLVTKENREFSSVRDLLDFTETRGVGSRTEMQSIATDMGLLERESDLVRVSDLGRAFTRLRDDVRGDVLHFLMYTGWDETTPLRFLSSWAYRDCCDRYWAQGNLLLTSDYLNRQVEETINNTREIFERISAGEFDEVSFSRMSLRGVRKWLDALQPPVIEGDTFIRRSFCPPELMALAVGYVFRDDPDIAEMDIWLSREKRDEICHVCLLEPDAFDRTLDWTLSVFPKLVEPGTEAGTYGRFIRVHKLPTLADVVR